MQREKLTLRKKKTNKKKTIVGLKMMSPNQHDSDDDIIKNVIGLDRDEQDNTLEQTVLHHHLTSSQGSSRSLSTGYNLFWDLENIQEPIFLLLLVVGLVVQPVSEEKASIFRDKKMSLTCVKMSEDVWLTCLTHALSTETEEIMGLLLGDIEVCSLSFSSF